MLALIQPPSPHGVVKATCGIDDGAPLPTKRSVRAKLSQYLFYELYGEAILPIKVSERVSGLSMVFEFSCERLRERRTFVMGVAALMIYFAHFYAYADLGLLNKLFAYGNWGVDVFLLLSGFGMCYSMSKPCSSIDFYWKRLVRIGVPYLVLAIPFCFVSDILVAQTADWGLFVLDLSTLSYWLLHRGAWYVAMLVPLYLLVPFFGRLANRFGAAFFCVISAVFCALLSLGLNWSFSDSDIVVNVVFVIQRLPSFFVGWLFADRLMSGKDWTVGLQEAILTSGIALFAWFLTRNTGCTGFLPALLIAFWVSGFHQLPLEGLFEKLGEASLESYLLNIYVLAFMRDVFGWGGGFLAISRSLWLRFPEHSSFIVFWRGR